MRPPLLNVVVLRLRTEPLSRLTVPPALLEMLERLVVPLPRLTVPKLFSVRPLMDVPPPRLMRPLFFREEPLAKTSCAAASPPRAVSRLSVAPAATVVVAETCVAAPLRTVKVPAMSRLLSASVAP